VFLDVVRAIEQTKNIGSRGWQFGLDFVDPHGNNATLKLP
jgi:hypothetical protein